MTATAGGLVSWAQEDACVAIVIVDQHEQKNQQGYESHVTPPFGWYAFKVQVSIERRTVR
jgi:hypothetical protein